MGSKILIIKDCDFCFRCPCRHYEGEVTDIATCGVTKEIIPEGVKLPKWCPLKTLPDRLTEGVSTEYAQGWNAAIDMIELG